MEQQSQPIGKSWYDKYYRILMLIPILIVIASLVYLGAFYSQHGDVMFKDSSLSGGTTITVTGDVDAAKLDTLKKDFPDLVIRKLSDVRTGKSIASILESSASSETLKPAVEKTLGYNLTSDNSSIEFSGPTLSAGFYRQLVIALLIAFILMSVVILIMFRTVIPTIAVIFAAFSDIIIPLAIVDYFGIKLSAAGIAAFLMLIGYSVDTDILLTTRAIKIKEGFLNERIFKAFKTGIFMTSTAIAAVLPAFFIITGLPDSFRQIFLILALGLFSDIANTWLTNAGIIKWYADAKGIK